MKIKGVCQEIKKLTNLLILCLVCLILASMNSNNIGGHMKTKTMTSKYPGWCRNCRQPFEAGTEINWSPETKATHVVCPIPEVEPIPYQKASTPEQLVPGVYETINGIFVVNNLYAKKLVELNGDYRTTEAGSRVDFEFEYSKGAIYDLRLDDRMPIERAKELITPLRPLHQLRSSSEGGQVGRNKALVRSASRVLAPLSTQWSRQPTVGRL